MAGSGLSPTKRGEKVGAEEWHGREVGSGDDNGANLRSAGPSMKGYSALVNKIYKGRIAVAERVGQQVWAHARQRSLRESGECSLQIVSV